MDILALRSVRNIPSQVAPIPFFQAGQEEVSIPPVPAAVRGEALFQRSGRIVQELAAADDEVLFSIQNIISPIIRVIAGPGSRDIDLG